MIKWQRDYAGSYTSHCGKYNIHHNGQDAWNIGYRVETSSGLVQYKYSDACNTLACAKACTQNTAEKEIKSLKGKPAPALGAMLRFGKA